ncbi:ABC transporter permease [Streptomyces pluripotens]|uniref:ABC transporter permease n=1 Tax=Streptomyces pluripotens TaxID=1355015 RepID=A0A221P134_9ACTN|nr:MULTISPECIES: ABC transporter permease [Streptomyces]ARP71535.1 ABC transporter permease [Streptomyces pluripotens]ASN25786.1 ABC transporter permease [Streptomyces pluripotens]KIE25094.1 membrane protein [Streptomyces sp. MUSC 125]MCH0557453.1 ABC transporter permease [Streptomyces sp. MUM 16J]
MSTLTANPETPETAPAASARPTYRVTGRRVLSSEWAKLWSLRSTWITLGLGLLFLIAFGVIAASHYKSNLDSGRHMRGDFATATAVSLSLFGTNFAQLALGVLGVLVTAGEYSTGMIRSTLAAVPRRLPVLWSKAAVYGLVALVVGTVGAFVAFLIGSQIVSGTPAAMGLGHAGVARSLLGAGLYLGLVGVIGAALGALLRSVAGGISVLVAALMLVPGLVSLLPSSWQGNIDPYLPSHAGESIFALTHDSTTLSPGAGLLVFLGWTVLALAGAAYRLVRSDV